VSTGRNIGILKNLERANLAFLFYKRLTHHYLSKKNTRLSYWIRKCLHYIGLLNSRQALVFLSLGTILMCQSACNSSKFMADNEYLLKKNSFEIVDQQDDVTPSVVKRGLQFFVPVEPNTRFLWIPREYVYLKNTSKKDPSRFSDWKRRNIGETPSLWNDSIYLNAAQSMTNFLRYKKGFYHANVQLDVRKKNNKAFVQFIVETGPQYRVGSIEFVSKDKQILEELKDIHINSLVKNGEPIDADIFETEKNRMTIELQNRGYAEFTSQFISIKGDSTEKLNTIDIIFDILTPSGDSLHRKFRVGNIKVFTDHYAQQDTSFLNLVNKDQLQFYRESSEFVVNPEVLIRTIFPRPNDLVSRSERNRTIRKLNSLSTYQFFSINPKITDRDSSIIDYDIFLTPHLKKWSMDVGSDIFYSTVNEVGRRVIGLGFNSQLQNKNFLGGSEKYTLSALTGSEFEIQLRDTTRMDPLAKMRTFNVSIQNNLEFPILKDPFNFIKTANYLGILKNRYRKAFQDEGITNLNLGFNYINVLEFYTINSINASFGFRAPIAHNKTLSINQIGLSLNRFDLREQFEIIIGDSPFVRNTFSDNLLTGFLLKDIFYVYSGLKNRKGESFGMIANLEMSGWEKYIINKSYNIITGTDKFLTIGEENPIEFAKFFRLDLDGRFVKLINKKSSIATRLNTGIIVPFGDSEANPYIRQFDVGGPNSLRAWDQRFIGPGSHRQILQGPQNLGFQKGDVRIEANLEYRLDLFWLIELGLFVDAANIWLLKDDPERPGAQFSKNFLEEFAIGAGYGIRFDVTYFLIRFDFGYKIRDPYPDPETGKNWYSLRRIRDQKLGNLQLAVNYPF
jgi:outer membrane protein insertion porin family